MQRQVIWAPETGPGLEHLQLARQTNGIVADGLVIGLKDQEPFRLHYEIHGDSNWTVRSVRVTLLSGSRPSLHLFTDGAGSWTMGGGKPLPALDGCLDVDIAVTPFTNTLPIRRLALAPGASTTLRMAYIPAPDLQVHATHQRYTCLETSALGGRYRFESLEQGLPRFTAELAVDQDGLVVDYPGLFRRVG